MLYAPRIYEQLYLESWPEFQHPILTDRLGSLLCLQTGLCLRIGSPDLALTSSAIDRIFARLEHKFASSKQFRTDESGWATLTAWSIVHNLGRSGEGARRVGKSPAELARVALGEQPWFQYVLIQLSRVQRLKPARVIPT